MPTMAIMIGIQASGKSTFCKQFLGNYTRVNLDSLHTRNKEKLAIEDAITQGEDVVIDNTNPMSIDREKYILRGKAAGYKIVGYFMQSKLQDCIARNESRTGKEKIPKKAIACTSNKLELPTYKEGFDELYYVSLSEGDTQISEWRNEE